MLRNIFGERTPESWSNLHELAFVIPTKHKMATESQGTNQMRGLACIIANS